MAFEQFNVYTDQLIADYKTHKAKYRYAEAGQIFNCLLQFYLIVLRPGKLSAQRNYMISRIEEIEPRLVDSFKGKKPKAKKEVSGNDNNF